MEELYEISREARKKAKHLSFQKFIEAIKWTSIITKDDQILSIAVASCQPFPVTRDGNRHVTKDDKGEWHVGEFKYMADDFEIKKLIAEHMYDADQAFCIYDKHLLQLYRNAIAVNDSS